MQLHTSQVIAAIGSRSLDRSEAFAGRHGVRAAFGSYEELAASDVDIIYVATPHNFHYEAALMALDAGKHVLVEKPIGINREQAAGIASRAAGAGLFAAEAMSANPTASWRSVSGTNPESTPSFPPLCPLPADARP